MGYSPFSHKELDTTEWRARTHTHIHPELLGLANASDSQLQSQTTWTTGWGPWWMAPELPTTLGSGGQMARTAVSLS